MITWRTGQVIVTRSRRAQEGGLSEFLDGLAAIEPPLVRVPGVAVFLNPSKDTTPLAMRAEVKHTHTLHQRVVIVSVDTVSIPHVAPSDRFSVQSLGSGRFKVSHVTVRVGYHDAVNVPEALELCRKQGMLERNLDLEHASYFVSRITITPTPAPGMARVAQEDLHRDGPQRRQPDRPLRAAERPHRDHGLAGRAVTPEPARAGPLAGERRRRYRTPVRVATWNVNSVKQRVPRLLPWLDQREPDVVCLQETKLADDAFDQLLGEELASRGYAVARHGEAQWNGVAILSRLGLEDIVVGVAGAPGFPRPEARAVSATCGGIRVYCVYVPNGRVPDSEHYHYKLAWLARAARDGRARSGRPRWCAGT